MRINNPLSQQQIKQGDLIAPGEYFFEVMDAEETVSKSGNDMIKLKLKIFVENKERIVYDYLLEAMEFKLGHFAECSGLADKYREGVLSANDCVGKSGSLKLIIQEDKTGQYGDKNSVADYLLTKEDQDAKLARKAAQATDASSPPDILDDDLPF